MSAIRTRELLEAVERGRKRRVEEIQRENARMLDESRAAMDRRSKVIAAILRRMADGALLEIVEDKTAAGLDSVSCMAGDPTFNALTGGLGNCSHLTDAVNLIDGFRAVLTERVYSTCTITWPGAAKVHPPLPERELPSDLATRARESQPGVARPEPQGFGSDLVAGLVDVAAAATTLLDVD